ncbi:MAG: hypothetical protein M3N91_08355 [Pseudomonadota bacterium]|nr:hypothetical protein [Pseudomonadota bacterium]
MNAVLDNFLVGVLLLASLSYAVYKLGPRTLKKRILAALSRMMSAAPAYLRLGRAAQRLTVASAGTAGSCGGCDNCGSESSPEPKPSSAEIKIPVANIGRRA